LNKKRKERSVYDILREREREGGKEGERDTVREREKGSNQVVGVQKRELERRERNRERE